MANQINVETLRTAHQAGTDCLKGESKQTIKIGGKAGLTVSLTSEKFVTSADASEIANAIETATDTVKMSGKLTSDDGSTIVAQTRSYTPSALASLIRTHAGLLPTGKPAKATGANGKATANNGTATP